MTSLDKFIVRVYRRIYKDREAELEKVDSKEILMYLSKAEETDIIYLASVMIQFHPSLYEAKSKVIRGNDLRDLLTRCVLTPYYRNLVKVCNDNIELFKSLVKERHQC